MMHQEINTTNRVSFPVSDVKLGTLQLPGINIRALLQQKVQAALLVGPNVEQRMVECGDFHPLIAAAAIAFKQHYPLVLSPDMFWLTILQGVAQHIANHPESLRSRLVFHETRIELVVDTNLLGLPTNDAEMLAATRAFADAIHKHSPADKHFLFGTEFTTTTDVERIAAAIVMMDAFQPYFDYVFTCICGIPSVTLEGTTEDWSLLATKVRQLHDSDLDLAWWTKHLLPLCDQFVRASRGDMDRHHWQNLFKLYERYGTEDLNGWLLKFIPYIRKDRNEVPTHRNPILDLTSYDDTAEKLRNLGAKITGCTSAMLPTGLSQTPVTCLNRSSGKKERLQFLSGFVGVSQSANDACIRPVVGWAIARRTSIDALIEELRMRHSCTAPQGTKIEDIIEAFGGYLPGDMWKFYSEIQSVSLRYLVRNQFREVNCTIGNFRSAQPIWDWQNIRGELEALHEQGEISANCFAERQEFAQKYGRLRKIAWAGDGKRSASYLFGQIPGSDAVIFRWDGKRNPSAFTPVAKSFTEWLTTVLDAARPQ